MKGRRHSVAKGRSCPRTPLISVIVSLPLGKRLRRPCISWSCPHSGAPCSWELTGTPISAVWPPGEGRRAGTEQGRWEPWRGGSLAGCLPSSLCPWKEAAVLTPTGPHTTAFVQFPLRFGFRPVSKPRLAPSRLAVMRRSWRCLEPHMFCRASPSLTEDPC